MAKTTPLWMFTRANTGEPIAVQGLPISNPAIEKKYNELKQELIQQYIKCDCENQPDSIKCMELDRVIENIGSTMARNVTKGLHKQNAGKRTRKHKKSKKTRKLKN